MDTADSVLADRLDIAVGEFVRATRAVNDTLSPSHAQPLGYLDRDGSLSIAELAQRRGVRHQSMSATVAELEALGYLQRRPDPNDGRAVRLRITRKGLTALNRDRRARNRWIADAIASRLTCTERDILEAVPDILDHLRS